MRQLDARCLRTGIEGVEMTLHDQDRIKQAEAMNLLPDHFHGWGEYKDALEKYDGEVLRILLALIPDPENDANDCEALIQWLTEQQYCLTVDFWMGIVQLHTWNEQLVITSEGKDWKQGVCELALKVLDEKP